MFKTFWTIHLQDEQFKYQKGQKILKKPNRGSMVWRKEIMEVASTSLCLLLNQR
jgi:hypothetical protein